MHTAGVVGIWCGRGEPQLYNQLTARPACTSQSLLAANQVMCCLRLTMAFRLALLDELCGALADSAGSRLVHSNTVVCQLHKHASLGLAGRGLIE